MPKEKPEETGEICPECGSPLVIRKGKFGSFTACSDYPNCKYVKKEIKEQKVIINCPNCNGQIVERHSKKGKVFYGCNHYPDCKTAYWYEPTGNKCSKCGGMLVKKQDSIVCNECSYQIETQE